MVDLLVGLSVRILKGGGRLHFHAPTGVFVTGMWCLYLHMTKFSLEKANQEIKKFSLRVVSTAVADMTVVSITYMYVLLI